MQVATTFSQAQKDESKVSNVCILPMWNLGTASIVLDDNVAGWPKLVLF